MPDLRRRSVLLAALIAVAAAAVSDVCRVVDTVSSQTVESAAFESPEVASETDTILAIADDVSAPVAAAAPATEAVAVAVAVAAPPPTTTPTPRPPPSTAPTVPATVVRASEDDPGLASPLARAAAALRTSVPPAWQQAVPFRLSIISGSASWAYPDGRIQVTASNAKAPWDFLRVVVTHEFGHLIAFHYGSQVFHGAAPAGWPFSGRRRPEEAWADCVAEAFTGVSDHPSHGLAPCPATSLAWTRTWLAQGPDAHQT